jgi:hypothetical protein
VHLSTAWFAGPRRKRAESSTADRARALLFIEAEEATPMKKTKKPLSIAKESLTNLTVPELDRILGGVRNENGTHTCSCRQGSCLSCGPTMCP